MKKEKKKTRHDKYMKEMREIVNDLRATVLKDPIVIRKVKNKNKRQINGRS